MSKSTPKQSDRSAMLWQTQDWALVREGLVEVAGYWRRDAAKLRRANQRLNIASTLIDQADKVETLVVEIDALNNDYQE